jgi:hypothetical protein
MLSSLLLLGALLTADLPQAPGLSEIGLECARYAQPLSDCPIELWFDRCDLLDDEEDKDEEDQDTCEEGDVPAWRQPDREEGTRPRSYPWRPVRSPTHPISRDWSLASRAPPAL